jgi:hypothetical protein
VNALSIGREESNLNSSTVIGVDALYLQRNKSSASDLVASDSNLKQLVMTAQSHRKMDEHGLKSHQA